MHFLDIPLSAHAGYEDLINIVERISPKHVIYVHGSGIVQP